MPRKPIPYGICTNPGDLDPVRIFNILFDLMEHQHGSKIYDAEIKVDGKVVFKGRNRGGAA